MLPKIVIKQNLVHLLYEQSQFPVLVFLNSFYLFIFLFGKVIQDSHAFGSTAPSAGQNRKSHINHSCAHKFKKSGFLSLFFF